MSTRYYVRHLEPASMDIDICFTLEAAQDHSYTVMKIIKEDFRFDKTLMLHSKLLDGRSYSNFFKINISSDIKLPLYLLGSNFSPDPIFLNKIEFRGANNTRKYVMPVVGYNENSKNLYTAGHVFDRKTGKRFVGIC